MAAVFNFFPFDNRSMDEQDWKLMFQWVRSDGILTSTGSLSSVGDSFVAPDSNMTLQIYPGLAWIQGFYFSYEEDPLDPGNYTFSIDPNPDVDPRIDLVIIRLDLVNNDIEYAVLEGTPDPSPIPPDLTQTNLTWEIAIASVYVASGVTVINSGDITDLRNISSQNTTSEAIFGNLYSTNNSTATTFTNSTAYVPMVVTGAGTLSESPSVLFTQSPNGSLVYNGFNNIYYACNATISFDASVNATSLDLCFLQNGTLVPGSFIRTSLATSGSLQTATIQSMLLLDFGDVITIGVRNRSWTAAQTITIITYNISVTST